MMKEIYLCVPYTFSWSLVDVVMNEIQQYRPEPFVKTIEDTIL